MLDFKNYIKESLLLESHMVIDERAFILAKDLCEWLSNELILESNDEVEDIDDELLKSKGITKDQLKKHKDILNKRQSPTELTDPLTDISKEDDDIDLDDEDDTRTGDLDLEDDGKTPEIEENDEKMAEQWAENVYESAKPDPTLTNYRKTYSVLLGRMYAFKYDPKHKDKLPIYDTAPLVITFDFKNGADDTPGFLGVNLHFIPRHEREATIKYFMTKNPEDVMKKGKIDIDYERDLKNNPRLTYIYYCIRHYLLNHVIGALKLIPQNEYPMAYKLHSAKFLPSGKSESQITSEIRRKSVSRSMSQILKKTQAKKDLANQRRKAQLQAQRDAKAKALEQGQITPLKDTSELKKEKEINMVKAPIKEKEKIKGNL